MICQNIAYVNFCAKQAATEKSDSKNFRMRQFINSLTLTPVTNIVLNFFYQEEHYAKKCCGLYDGINITNILFYILSITYLIKLALLIEKRLKKNAI